MGKMVRHMCGILLVLIQAIFLMPANGFAIQLHQTNEGILVHQFGHLFFLLSMVVLILIITGRELHRERGWRLILFSAILFVLWNLDTILAHFFDNQINAVTVVKVTPWTIRVASLTGSDFLALLYHILKLDHLLCVPAMFLFYRGLSVLLAQERKKRKRRGSHQRHSGADRGGVPDGEEGL